MFTLTEKEIDSILDRVEKDLEAVRKSEQLSKSEGSQEPSDQKDAESLAKMDQGKEVKPVDDKNGNADNPDAGKGGDHQYNTQSASDPASGASDKSSGLEKDALLPEDDGASDAPMMGADEGMGDQGMGEEEMGDDLSDEELMEIYHSMSPDELERHYMACRAAMQSAYSDNGMEAQADLSDQGMGDQGMGDEGYMKSEDADQVAKSESDKGENMDESEGIQKSEETSVQSKKIEDLEKSNQELKGSLEKITTLLLKNIEKPERKAATDLHSIEWIGKSEDTSEEDNGDKIDMSDDEIRVACLKKSQDPQTTSSDRQMINDFYLNGEKSQELLKMLSGGKE